MDETKDKRANVILKDKGLNPLSIIKILREETNMSVAEAREKITVTKDSLLFKNICLEDALAYKKDFEALGAKIEIIILEEK